MFSRHHSLISGYCLKDVSQDERIKTVQVVLSGKTDISPGVADKVMEGYIERGDKTGLFLKGFHQSLCFLHHQIPFRL